jgi:hypothetical protein
MKRALFSLILLPLLILPLAGCPAASSTTPPAALAPGYTSQVDQQMGQALAALRAGDYAATTAYLSLTPAQQAAEKTALNNFTSAVNTADTLYLAYHAGVTVANPNPPTQAQVQAAVAAATSAQTNFNATLGVKQ